MKLIKKFKERITILFLIFFKIVFYIKIISENFLIFDYKIKFKMAFSIPNTPKKDLWSIN